MTEVEQSPILHKHNSAGNVNDLRTPSNVNTFTQIKQNYNLTLLCVLFGMGTWMPVNSIYSQLPNLSGKAPEGWDLASYFTLLVQAANVAPLLYYVFRNKLCIYQSVLICIFLLIGTISMFTITFTYDMTIVLFGQSHSVFFFIFSFFISMLGCISSVLFIPFMYKLPELYLVPFFIGEGLSGLIPSAIAIVQGVGKEVCIDGQKTYLEPVFSTTTFLCIIGLFMVLSTFSFIYLNYFSNFVEKIKSPVVNKNYNTNNNSSKPFNNGLTLSKSIILLLLVIQTLVNCFSNGVLPGIQSYSCMPYGADAYHWSVLINQITNPIVMYFAFFLPVISIRVLGISVTVLILCVGYEMLTAFMSPTPPMIGIPAGFVTIVLVWMLGSALISYVKISIASIFRRHSHLGLIDYGLSTQIGSAFGAVASFLMVNYFKLFEPAEDTNCR